MSQNWGQTRATPTASVLLQSIAQKKWIQPGNKNPETPKPVQVTGRAAREAHSATHFTCVNVCFQARSQQKCETQEKQQQTTQKAAEQLAALQPRVYKPSCSRRGSGVRTKKSNSSQFTKKSTQTQPKMQEIRTTQKAAGQLAAWPKLLCSCNGKLLCSWLLCSHTHKQGMHAKLFFDFVAVLATLHGRFPYGCAIKRTRHKQLCQCRTTLHK